MIENKTRESQLRATKKYDQTHTRKVTFKFNLKTDADVLKKFDSVKIVKDM
jgi:hypothetical protein